MHDRGVIAPAKASAYLGQAAAGQLLGQVHGNLSRAGNGAHPLGADHVRQADVVVLGHFALNLFDRDLAVRRTQNIGKAVLRQVQRNFAAHQAGEGEQTRQGTFQHADVGGNAVRQKFQNAGGNHQVAVLAVIEFGFLL